MSVRNSRIIAALAAVLASGTLSACGGGGSQPLPSAPLAAASPGQSTPSTANAASRSASTSTVTPNYLGYVSYFWGDQNQWTINCDAPTYFAPNTCLVVNVQAGVKQYDGPPLAVGEFVAIYADPKTASAGGLSASWFRTSLTPFAGSPLPKGYSAATPAPSATGTPAPTKTAAPTAAPTVAATAAPTLAPTPAPTPSVSNALGGVYAQLFSASSPFRTTAAQLKAAGASVLAQSAMNSLWNQGIGSQDLGPSTYMFPLYVSSAGDPLATIACTGYGRCNANGMQIHVPSGAQPEGHADGHIAVIDTVQNVEFDGYQCSRGSGTLSCTWGGKYALGGSGITNSGSDAVHGGYAAGVMNITAQELLNGHIDHALAVATKCLNNPTVYPADPNNGGSDAGCGGSGAPSYGHMMHLLLSPSQIAATQHSAECKTILTALATYGAYTYDTGSTGLSLITQSTLSYSALGASSPWMTTILPHMAAAGEASGTYWYSCLNGLSASNFELVQIPAGSY